jgi:hypothetical protein
MNRGCTLDAGFVLFRIQRGMILQELTRFESRGVPGAQRLGTNATVSATTR